MRLYGASSRTDVGTLSVDGQVAPAHELDALLGDDPLDHPDGTGPLAGVRGQEGVAHGIGRLPGSGGLRQGEVGDLTEELVRHLHEDSGAVTGVDLGAGGTAMFQIAQ